MNTHRLSVANRRWYKQTMNREMVVWKVDRKEKEEEKEKEIGEQRVARVWVEGGGLNESRREGNVERKCH